MKSHLPRVQKTFVSADLEKQLDEKGYVILPNMMLDEEIKEVNTFYLQASANGTKGQHDPKNTIDDKDFRPKMSRMVKNILQPHVTEIFVDHKVIAGHLIVKEPFVDSDIKIHHEFSFLDEKVFRPINLWSPLMDVDQSNGAIQVLDGSHRLENPYRGYTLPSPYSTIFPQFSIYCKQTQMSRTDEHVRLEKGLHESFHTLAMSKGDLLVFDSKLLHQSFSVSSGQTRIAVAGLVAPMSAPLRIYFGKGNATIEEYGITEDFFLTWNNIDSPERSFLLRELEHDFFTLSNHDKKLLRLLANGESDKTNWFRKAVRRLIENVN